MSAASDQLGVSPVATSIDNPGEWPEIAQRLEAQTGMPTQLTPELVAHTVGSALALLFHAEASRDANVLRGTFADTVVAQCQRFAGTLAGDTPLSAVVHLVGVPPVHGAQSSVRVHVAAQVRRADGSEGVDSQFWDLQTGAQVTVGQTSCPNCGAPLAGGELVCSHCQTDVRRVVEAPLVVAKLELY